MFSVISNAPMTGDVAMCQVTQHLLDNTLLGVVSTVANVAEFYDWRMIGCDAT